MIKVDTHFHPNFMFRLPKKIGVSRQAKNIWKSFSKHGLDAVIVTEHVFKHPAMSYKFLQEHKPLEAKTVLIPGVEASTKEGIDMIVFSKDTYVYTCEPIMTTGKLSFDEMIDYIIEDDNLYGVVTHPFSLSQTAVTKHYPVEKVLEATKKLGIIEKHNTSFVSMQRYFSSTFVSEIPLLRELLEQMELVENVPDDHYVSTSVLFGGSDAHHPDDIGDYTVFQEKKKSIWQVITNYSVPRTFHISKDKVNVFWYMFRNLFIVARERVINVCKLYVVDGTYFLKRNKRKNKIKNNKMLYLRLKSYISGIEFS